MEQHEFGLLQLAELVAKAYETGPVVMRYLSEKGLMLPSIKSSVGSSKMSSASSVASSARSTASSTTSKSSKTALSNSSRTSSCLITPSVVTLDSSGLS